MDKDIIPCHNIYIKNNIIPFFYDKVFDRGYDNDYSLDIISHLNVLSITGINKHKKAHMYIKTPLYFNGNFRVFGSGKEFTKEKYKYFPNYIKDNIGDKYKNKIIAVCPGFLPQKTPSLQIKNTYDNTKTYRLAMYFPLTKRVDNKVTVYHCMISNPITILKYDTLMFMSNNAVVLNNIYIPDYRNVKRIRYIIENSTLQYKSIVSDLYNDKLNRCLLMFIYDYICGDTRTNHLLPSIGEAKSTHKILYPV